MVMLKVCYTAEPTGGQSVLQATQTKQSDTPVVPSQKRL